MDSMSALLTRVARSGAAVLFSSHQLDMVEHLCEDVVVIDSGRVVLQGRLETIRDASQDRYLDVTTRGPIEPLLDSPQATVVTREDGHVRLRIPASMDPGQLLRIADRDVVRLSFEPPTLSELFRAAVTHARDSADQRAERQVRDDHT
jgi:ABC-2 type transport system ATP-binding protein